MKTTLVLAILACVGLTVAAQKNGIECDACKAFASEIKKFVEKQVPLEEVEKEAKALCDMLPIEQLKDFCEKHLIPEVDKLYEELDKETPEDACKLLELC
ncbi:unnamed protein product [Diabrotica balteata]|uniref:Saposin B-type domain-containing protein n=1 Tax=Diabrotica balteata TaxID=107213 RepID=A0A9N9T287_DIABA|nr:unnamed protein product [Diabrotica balteata]